jgi:sec-independent protein translocase protein TatC
MQDRRLSLIEHLDELRRRLIQCLVPFLASTLFSAVFTKQILSFLRLPARGAIEKLVFFSPQEVALVYIKIALLTGLVASSPFILYHIWKFISPALEERQRRYTINFIFFTWLSFFIGACFCFFGLLPISLRFLIGLAGDELMPVISISKYISFVLILTLGCGLTFEMPVLAWILTKLHILNANFLRRKRKYAVVIILILAAIITPTTDPFNMFLLAIPMYILYEISIWVSQWNKTKD